MFVPIVLEEKLWKEWGRKITHRCFVWQIHACLHVLSSNMLQMCWWSHYSLCNQGWWGVSVRDSVWVCVTKCQWCYLFILLCFSLWEVLIWCRIVVKCIRARQKIEPFLFFGINSRMSSQVLWQEQAHEMMLASRMLSRVGISLQVQPDLHCTRAQSQSQLICQHQQSTCFARVILE